MPKTTVKSALVIGAIALLGLGLSGCSAAQEIVDSVEGELSGGESEVRDGETQEVTESSDLDGVAGLGFEELDEGVDGVRLRGVFAEGNGGDRDGRVVGGGFGRLAAGECEGADARDAEGEER